MHPQFHRFDGDTLHSAPPWHIPSFIRPWGGVHRRLNQASRIEHFPSVQLDRGHIAKRKVRSSSFLLISAPHATHEPLNRTIIHQSRFILKHGASRCNKSRSQTRHARCLRAKYNQPLQHTNAVLSRASFPFSLQFNLILVIEFHSNLLGELALFLKEILRN